LSGDVRPFDPWRSCALTAVSACLAEGLRQKDNTVRQRLREWCYEAPAKRGKKRQEVGVETCFAPLLAWVLSGWTGTQLPLAATTLGDRFVGLAISVLYRGCAIPVAWVVLEAGKKEAWRREWLRMLRQLRAAVPRGWTVLVLADRGLYARWLFRRIVRLGWHPFLRINNGGTFRPDGSPLYRLLTSWVPEVGTQWSGRGTAFKGRGRQLACTRVQRRRRSSRRPRHCPRPPDRGGDADRWGFGGRTEVPMESTLTKNLRLKERGEGTRKLNSPGR
jgi:hypothetical protein